jgi:hypothetical protein
LARTYGQVASILDIDLAISEPVVEEAVIETIVEEAVIEPIVEGISLHNAGVVGGVSGVGYALHADALVGVRAFPFYDDPLA